MQRCDLLLHNQIHQIIRIPVPFRTCHHQTSSGHQGPEEFPYRNIEAVRCLLQHPVRAIQRISGLHPQQPVHDCFMHIRHALRLTSGPRRIDHIRNVFAASQHRRVAQRLLRQQLPIAVQTNSREAMLWQNARQTLQRQHHGRLGIGQHRG